MAQRGDSHVAGVAAPTADRSGALSVASARALSHHEVLREWASKYRRLGWVVVPLTDARRPMYRWTAYRDELGAYASDWSRWATDGTWDRARGVGVLTEFAPLVVVDVDVPMEQASAHLSHVTGEHVRIEDIDYGVSRTQSGRAHLFFSADGRPKEALPSLSAKAAVDIGCPQVEVKHAGACIPLPPTRTATGSYEWVRQPYSTSTGDLHLAPPPPWLDAIFERLHSHREGQREGTSQRVPATRRNGGATSDDALAKEVARALQYSAAVPAAAHGTRYDSLASLAGSLAAAGFSTTAAWQAMASLGARCDPPVTEDEMRAKTLDKHLAKIAGGPHHQVAARGTPQPVVGAAPDDVEKTWLKFTTACQLADAPPVEIEWAWDGILPSGGSSIFASRPKVGKTTTALALAGAVAVGDRFLGRATEPGAVLYLALEEQQARLQDVARRHRVEGLRFHAGPVVMKPPGDAANELRLVVERYEARLVVIDTLGRFIPVADGNDYHGMSAALAPFHDLARLTGTHVMFLHHVGKARPADGDEELGVLGSTALTAVFDTVLTMWRNGERRTLTTTQRYGVDLPKTVVAVDEETGVVSAAGELSAVRRRELARRIIDVLPRTDGMARKEIEDEIGTTGPALRATLEELAADGRIRRTGKGKRGDPFMFTATQEAEEGCDC
jgi:hypothetical protein